MIPKKPIPNNIRTKDGLIFKDGKIVPAPQADWLAHEYGFAWVEDLVRYVAERQDHSMQFMNFKGKMVDAPADLRTVIASVFGGAIVWSYDGSQHQVRYCLQVETFNYTKIAAERFGHCIAHYAECAEWNQL